MIAYKFLESGAIGRFSRFRWPVPSAAGAGAWVEAGVPVACKCGIHACRPHDLAHWIDRELWRVELAGEQLETSSMVVAARGRLLAPVAAWDAERAREFAAYCLARARAFVDQVRERGDTAQPAALARKLAGDTEALAQANEVAAVAYVSAVAAHLASDLPPDEAYAAERRAQSAWLVDKLKLA